MRSVIILFFREKIKINTSSICLKTSLNNWNVTDNLEILYILAAIQKALQFMYFLVKLEK